MKQVSMHRNPRNQFGTGMTGLIHVLGALVLIVLFTPAVTCDAKVVTMILEGTGEIERDGLDVFAFGSGPQVVTGSFTYDDEAAPSLEQLWATTWPAISFELAIGGQTFVSVVQVVTQQTPDLQAVIGEPAGPGTSRVMSAVVWGPPQVLGEFPDFDLNHPAVERTSIVLLFGDPADPDHSYFEGYLSSLDPPPTQIVGGTWGQVKSLFR